MPSKASSSFVFFLADASQKRQINSGLNNFDWKCLKRSATFYRTWSCRIQWISCFCCVEWGCKDQWTAFFFAIWFEQKELCLCKDSPCLSSVSLVGAVCMHRYSVYGCHCPKGKSESQHFRHWALRAHRCFTLLLELLLKIFQVGKGTDNWLLTFYWSTLHWQLPNRLEVKIYFNKKIQPTPYAHPSAFLSVFS